MVNEENEEKYLLKLYVAGQTPKSLAAFANLKKICEEHLQDRYIIEVVVSVFLPIIFLHSLSHRFLPRDWLRF